MKAIELALGFVHLIGWLTLVAGVALLIAPRLTLRGFARLGHYDPIGGCVTWLDQKQFVERYIYRHHQLFGALVVLGALYTTYFLARPALDGEPGASIALLTAVRFLWLTNLSLVLFGVVIFVRPSALKGFEKWANRWVGVESEMRLAQWMEHAPRVGGAVVAAIGLYIVSLVTYYG